MLSQSEIDALLKGAIEIEGRDGEDSVNLSEIMDGEAPQQRAPSGTSSVRPGTSQKVVAYNFWSPERFSKEQMRAVELVHEDLAERLTTSLPTYLRTNVKPKLVHTEQGRFSDFLVDLPENTLYHLITLNPLPNQMVLTVSPNISYIMLEQLLGGKVDRKLKDRPLTDIDQSLLRNVIESMLNDLTAAWSKVSSIEPSLDDSTINQHWVQMFLGNERVMLVLFELTISNVTGSMNIYIPFNSLKPIADKLNPHIFISGRKENQVDPIARQMILNSVSQAFLPLRVYLGSANITLNEIVNLEEGSVIELNAGINNELVLQIAGHDKFMVRVGKSGKNLAVQVTSPIDAAKKSLQNEIGKK